MSSLAASSAQMERAESDWEKLLALAATSTAPPLIAVDTPAPRRVVSLLGAATETVARLGCADLLVGRSHECDWPPAILKLPTVSAARINTLADSRAIDAAVRSFADAKEPVYAIEAETLERLAPDLVIVQDHCRVCAVTPNELAPSCARQLVLKPSTLADCLEDVARVGNALGESQRGAALRALLQARLDAVAAAVRDSSTPRAPGFRPPSPRRVAVLEWCAPLMGCGYWIPELIALAGGTPVLAAPPGAKTPTFTSVDEVLAAGAEVVIFALCGFEIERAARELIASCGGDGGVVARLRAAGVEMFVMDGNGLVNRSGPRLIESAEAIAEAVQPALRGWFGHLGTAYLDTLDSALERHAHSTPFASAPTSAPTVAAVAPPPPPPPSSTSASETERVAAGLPALGEADAAALTTVSAQLAALACGGSAGIAAAFALNSVSNRARFGDQAANFGAALNSVAAFAALLGPRAARTTITSRQPRPLPAADGGSARLVISVKVATAPEPTELEWELERDAGSDAAGGADEWLTARVGFAKCPS